MSKTLNFIKNRIDNRSRFLRYATLGTLALCAVLTWQLIGGQGSKGLGTANIIDAGPPSLASISPSPTNIKHLGPQAITTSPILALAAAPQVDSVRYFEAQTGRALSVDLGTGQNIVINDARQSGLLTALWVPKKNAAIEVTGDKVNTSYKLADFDTGGSFKIGNSVTALAISPGGEQVAYLDSKDGSAGIYRADSDGTDPQLILATRLSDVGLTWPVNGYLAIESRRLDHSGSDLTLITPQGWLSTVISNKDALEYRWSDDGAKLLFSFYDKNNGISLAYLDTTTGSVVPLTLATSARKCAWSHDGSFLVCGVPSSNSLSKDVPSDKTATQDNIFVLKLGGGSPQQVYTAKNSYLIGVIDPVITKSGRYFAFTNLFDQQLYSLGLSSSD